MNKNYNPVYEAYVIIRDVVEGTKDETHLIDALGYLGEALMEEG